MPYSSLFHITQVSFHGPSYYFNFIPITTAQGGLQPPRHRNLIPRLYDSIAKKAFFEERRSDGIPSLALSYVEVVRVDGDSRYLTIDKPASLSGRNPQMGLEKT